MCYRTSILKNTLQHLLQRVVRKFSLSEPQKSNSYLINVQCQLLSQSIQVIFTQNFVAIQFLMPVISFVPSESLLKNCWSLTNNLSNACSKVSKCCFISWMASKGRGSRSQMFFKTDVLKKFASRMYKCQYGHTFFRLFLVF